MRARIGTVLLLTRTSTPVARRRRLLVAVACTALAFLASSAVRLVSYDDLARHVQAGVPLAGYVTEPGLRRGVVTGVALSLLPFAVLLAQALRLGSTRREQRLASLRVAGASVRRLRLGAALDAATAAGPGALLGVLASVGVGACVRHLPWNLRVVVPTAPADIPALAGVLAAVTVVAAVAATGELRDGGAGLSTGLAVARPVGRARRASAVALTTALLLEGAALLAVPALVRQVALVLAPTFVVWAMTVAPFAALTAARRLARSGRPVDLVAAARLESDARTPGRVLAVSAVCGAAFTAAAVSLGDFVDADRHRPGDAAFFLTGIGTATLLAVVAVLVGVLALVIGASEQVVQSARATAALTAFGLSTTDLRRILLRQLEAVTRPAMIGGALLGGFSPVGIPALHRVGAVVAGVLASALLAWLAARLATALVSPQLRESTTPDHLRTV